MNIAAGLEERYGTHGHDIRITCLHTLDDVTITGLSCHLCGDNVTLTERNIGGWRTSHDRLDTPCNPTLRIAVTDYGDGVYE